MCFIVLFASPVVHQSDYFSLMTLCRLSNTLPQLYRAPPAPVVPVIPPAQRDGFQSHRVLCFGPAAWTTGSINQHRAEKAWC